MNIKNVSSSINSDTQEQFIGNSGLKKETVRGDKKAVDILGFTANIYVALVPKVIKIIKNTKTFSFIKEYSFLTFTVFVVFKIYLGVLNYENQIRVKRRRSES